MTQHAGLGLPGEKGNGGRRTETDRKQAPKHAAEETGLTCGVSTHLSRIEGGLNVTGPVTAMEDRPPPRQLGKVAIQATPKLGFYKKYF